MDPKVLRDVPLFEGLAERDLQAISAHAVTRDVARNTVLMRQGESPASLYVVLSGKVRVSVSDEDGRELVLATLGPAETFGELALIDDEPRSATVAATEESRIAVVSKDDFKRCLSRNPEIAINLLKHLSRRLREVNETAKGFALLDVQGRVVQLLRRLARDHDGRLISDPVTHQEIANMVGASREMVSRVIGSLKSEGLVQVEGKRFILGDR
jgi:CRP/FNR family cyclic AMP-dependent transcriptional regulator